MSLELLAQSMQQVTLYESLLSTCLGRASGVGKHMRRAVARSDLPGPEVPGCGQALARHAGGAAATDS
eukprot:6064219-Amphidinium_carterae.1